MYLFLFVHCLDPIVQTLTIGEIVVQLLCVSLRPRPELPRLFQPVDAHARPPPPPGQAHPGPHFPSPPLVARRHIESPPRRTFLGRQTEGGRVPRTTGERCETPVGEERPGGGQAAAGQAGEEGGRGGRSGEVREEGRRRRRRREGGGGERTRTKTQEASKTRQEAETGGGGDGGGALLNCCCWWW